MRHILLAIPISLLGAGLVQAKTVCVDDDTGRQVCRKNAPQRIVSLSPGSTELIFAAGGGSQVIGVDAHSDYPEEVANIPRVGGYPDTSIEAIIVLKPDFIVAWAGGNKQQLTSMLESVGIPMFYINPLDFSDISSAISRLGTLFGAEQQAQKAAAEVDSRYKAIAAGYSQKTQVTVFYEIWNTPLMSVNSHHIIGQVIEVCGGKNIFADARAQVPRVSMESLMAANPQVISSSTFIKDGKTIEQRWARWENIEAVKNHSFITLAGDSISRPTPRTLDAAQEFCEKLDVIRTSHYSKTPTADELIQRNKK